MNKQLLTLFTALFFATASWAQSNCTPNFAAPCDMPDPNYGICPDSTDNLPNGTPGQSYTVTLSIKIPASIVYQGQNVNLTKLGVTDVQVKKNWTGAYGALSTRGLSYLGSGTNQSSNPFGQPAVTNNCLWNAPSDACVVLTGTPSGVTTSDTLYFIIKSKANVGGLLWSDAPDNIDYRISFAATSGLKPVVSQKFEMNGNTPNPFNDKTTITFNAPKAGNVELKVYNLLGKLMFSETIAAVPGENNYLFKNTSLIDGVYIYSLNNGVATLSRKMIVAERP